MAACTPMQTHEDKQSLLARGDQLVNGIMTCNHCHTPKDKTGNAVMSRQFAGGAQRFDDATFTVTGSNITQDRETGIGAWSDAEIKRSLTDGVRPDGPRLAFVMPYPLYRTMTPRNLNALVAWLRPLPPLE